MTSLTFSYVRVLFVFTAKQANLLNQLQQPVPQSLSVLLTEAQRRHEKKEAKRVANRRSASVSRARKKALVQEMTDLNARLKRQALILSLLPDLVIAVDVDGVITFASDQVERILRFKPDILVGSKLTDLLVPSSREKLRKLFKELVGPEPKLDPSSVEAENRKGGPPKGLKGVSEISDPQDPPDDGKSAEASSSKGTAVAEVSDTSFPLSVVNVDVDPSSVPAKETDDNENNSDTSASRDSKRPSSLTNSMSIPRSPIAESSGNSGSDDGGGTTQKGKKGRMPSSDTSNTSSSMDQANANLERNVRWHNKKLKSMQSDEIGLFKDDVLGAAVTANNASARLSSLRVQAERPEGSSSEEDDSGYRESNESREESSSAGSDLTESNGEFPLWTRVTSVIPSTVLTRFYLGRRKPLAPTCNICLIRNDLTTLWCEVTSSVRTREPEEEYDESSEVDSRKPPPSQPDASRASSVTNETEVEVLASKPEEKEGVKEILLCLRPIRDGDEKVDPAFRFVSRAKGVEENNAGTRTIASVQVDVSSSSDQGRPSPGPAKKRKMLPSGEGGEYKRTRTESDVGVDAAIAESLVLMSSSKSA
jgi:PAS domain S-box-containing protein